MQEMATRGDVTVRIDTDLREKARELQINMSRLLEDALAGEIERRESIAATLSEGVLEVVLELVDHDGREYNGRFTGKLIAGGDSCDIYLLDDERVIVHDRDNAGYHVSGDPQEELQNCLDRDEYEGAMGALGLKPAPEVVDL